MRKLNNFSGRGAKLISNYPRFAQTKGCTKGCFAEIRAFLRTFELGDRTISYLLSLFLAESYRDIKVRFTSAILPWALLRTFFSQGSCPVII